MSEAPKVTFQLTAHGEQLEVRATAPGGECRAEGPMPSKAQIDPLVADPTWISAWEIQTIGQILYRSLLCDDVVQLASSVLEAGRRDGKPVHFELRFDADQTQLAQYPWEMIADDLGRFLVRDGLVDVTRYITYPQPPPILDATIRDLPLLRVRSQPAILPALAPIDLPLRNVETLSPATFERLQHRLLIERMALWGLHFDGHGRLISLPDGRQVGALAFEHNGDVEWITTEHLASVLYNAHVQLALLLACETAQVGNDLIFSGLAPGLILAGVPAVVGMQYPVPDDFANGFVRSFYEALLRQQDLLDAFRVARQMNSRDAWYSPVLYLRHRRTPAEEEAVKPAYHARSMDTAVPSEVQAGLDFLVRLWIRRPETKPLTDAELREELDVPDSVPIRTREAVADVKFEPVEGRRLRRGEVEVRLRSSRCEITPESMVLFVDEHLDAPPAIFAVRASHPGRASLVFSVWQAGGLIASVTHHVQVTAGKGPLQAAIDRTSQALPVEQEAPIPIPSPESPYLPRQEQVPAEVSRPVDQTMIIAEPRLPPAELTVRVGGEVYQYRLDKDMVTLGRSSHNDVQIQDPFVSRSHARLKRQGTTYEIYDLGSANGLLYHGQPVEQQILADGDVVQIGDRVTLQYHAPAAPPPDVPPPPSRPTQTELERPQPPPRPETSGCRNRLFLAVFLVIGLILFLVLSQVHLLAALALIVESIALAAVAS
jgi:hypothetical protein